MERSIYAFWYRNKSKPLKPYASWHDAEVASLLYSSNLARISPEQKDFASSLLYFKLMTNLAIMCAAGIEMKRWLAGSDKGQIESVALTKQREAALQLQLAEKNLENLTLRQQAFASSQQARPHIAQVLPAWVMKKAGMVRVCSPIIHRRSGSEIGADVYLLEVWWLWIYSEIRQCTFCNHYPASCLFKDILKRIWQRVQRVLLSAAFGQASRAMAQSLIYAYLSWVWLWLTCRLSIWFLIWQCKDNSIRLRGRWKPWLWMPKVCRKNYRRCNFPKTQKQGECSWQSAEHCRSVLLKSMLFTELVNLRYLHIFMQQCWAAPCICFISNSLIVHQVSWNRHFVLSDWAWDLPPFWHPTTTLNLTNGDFTLCCVLREGYMEGLQMLSCRMRMKRWARSSQRASCIPSRGR